MKSLRREKSPTLRQRIRIGNGSTTQCGILNKNYHSDFSWNHFWHILSLKRLWNSTFNLNMLHQNWFHVIFEFPHCAQRPLFIWIHLHSALHIAWWSRRRRKHLFLLPFHTRCRQCWICGLAKKDLFGEKDMIRMGQEKSY